MKGSVKAILGKPGTFKLCYDAPIAPGEKRKGRQKRETLTNTTKRDAERYLQRKLAEIESGNYQAQTRVAFIAYLRQWLDTRSSRLARRTAERYAALIEQIAANLDGGERIALSKVTPQHIERLLQRLIKCGGVYGGALSPTTALQAYAVVRAALRKAHRQRLIAHNPCDTVEPPRARRVDIPLLEAADLVRFLDALRGSPFYIAAVLAAFGALRRGEILALTWRDVDLSTGIVTIHQAVEESLQSLAFKEPKSGRPRRVALPAVAVEALQGHKLQQGMLREQLGNDWNTEALIVPSIVTGRVQFPSTFSKGHRARAEAAGFPSITLHTLRHAHVSLLGVLGVHPRVMQAQAGHHSSSFTMDRYQHLMSGAQVDAAVLLDRAMRDAGFQADSP
jgi:integrase